jgi:hypothetical protein
MSDLGNDLKRAGAQIKRHEAGASKPEPHPEAQRIREALETLPDDPTLYRDIALQAVDVLVGRLEQAEHGLQARMLAAYENAGVSEVFAMCAGIVERLEGELEQKDEALRDIAAYTKQPWTPREMVKAIRATVRRVDALGVPPPEEGVA